MDTNLHPRGSIVGKGNHSVSHIQRLKPRVEQVCQELGLHYATEQNAGRMYINLTGGAAQMPQQFTQEHGGYAPGSGGVPTPNQQDQQPHQQFQPGGHQGQQHGAHPQQNNHNAEIEAAVKMGTKMLPKILRKLGCCTVM
jgi:hypothetical protein